jgi:hypothetical protein
MEAVPNAVCRRRNRPPSYRLFQQEYRRKLDKTIGLKTVSLSLRLTIEDSYIHQDRDSNLRYLPGNDSGNDSKLERRVTDMAVVRNRRCNSCWSHEMMLVAWFKSRRVFRQPRYAFHMRLVNITPGVRL